MQLTNGRLRVATVLGTRPEIIKCSPVIPLLDALADQTLIHTGQHYDDNMDSSFFRDLGLRRPDHSLAVGSSSQATQLARMLTGIEPILEQTRPDWVVVQGDTNSTLAGALAAAKMGIKVAHIEAGCRSFNRAMPEEMNRVVVDHISELCLAPDDAAATNLRNEGVSEHRIITVGSTGIDACLRASQMPHTRDVATALGVEAGTYLAVTIHRAENTTAEHLSELLGALDELSAIWPVIFPVHPRTAHAMLGLKRPPRVHFIEPAGYREMIGLLRGCRALLTDSGGLQEEAAVLGVPTFILRDETEWMVFVDAGHHRLVGTRHRRIVGEVCKTLNGGFQELRMRQPIGHERGGAAERIVKTLLSSAVVATV